MISIGFIGVFFCPIVSSVSYICNPFFVSSMSLVQCQRGVLAYCTFMQAALSLFGEEHL